MSTHLIPNKKKGELQAAVVCQGILHKCERKQIKMPREAEPSLNERQFVLKALEENLRLDGRAFDKYRPLELTFGDEYGVADVSLGKTR